MNLENKVLTYVGEGLFDKKIALFLLEFINSARDICIEQCHDLRATEDLLETLCDLVVKQCSFPFVFEPYHQRCQEPFDYYSFGLDFFRPLINWELSKVYQWHILAKMEQELKNGDNVVLFANHQSEADPQFFSLLIEDKYPSLAENIIFVAGERVLQDPLAAPFSMGRNLICIYSKKHIETPPERKTEKQMHNKRTMKRVAEMFEEGGQYIYVAPSGGRDRLDANGDIFVAPFDPQSIEMFYLMAKRSKHKTHFYPLTLSTFNVIPPPKHVAKELGENRCLNYSHIQMAFADEIDMESSSFQHPDKHTKRQLRAEAFYRIVEQSHRSLLNH